MLKECLIEMLCDSKLTSYTTERTKTQIKTKRQDKKAVLNCLYQYLRDAEQFRLRSGPRLDFRKRYSGSFARKYFFAHGLIGMLKDSDFESVHQVSPLLVAQAYKISENEQNRKVMQHIASYVERLWRTRCADTSSFRTECNLMLLKVRVFRVKAVGKSVFGAYQHSDTGGQKQHFL